MFTDRQIIEFQEIYRQHYGKEISRQEALDQGIKLIRLLKRIYTPMTVDQYDAIQSRRVETLPQMLTHFRTHDPDFDLNESQTAQDTVPEEKT